LKKTVIGVAPLLLAVFLPASIRAQSLGDVAAKEKEKKKEQQAHQKEPAKAYTNDDLAHGQTTKKDKTAEGENTAAAAFTPESSAPNGRRAEASSAEKTWRARAQSARDAVKAAEGKVTSLDDQAKLLLTRRIQSTDTNEILRLMSEQRDVLDQIETAKHDVEAAQKALEDFMQSARAANIPAGWLEPPPP
jgi:hypothetical protein